MPREFREDVKRAVRETLTTALSKIVDGRYELKEKNPGVLEVVESTLRRIARMIMDARKKVRYCPAKYPVVAGLLMDAALLLSAISDLSRHFKIALSAVEKSLELLRSEYGDLPAWWYSP